MFCLALHKDVVVVDACDSFSVGKLLLFFAFPIPFPLLSRGLVRGSNIGILLNSLDRPIQRINAFCTCIILAPSELCFVVYDRLADCAGPRVRVKLLVLGLDVEVLLLGTTNQERVPKCLSIRATEPDKGEKNGGTGFRRGEGGYASAQFLLTSNVSPDTMRNLHMGFGIV